MPDEYTHRLAKVITRYSRRNDVAVACAKAFMRCIEAEGTVLDPLMALQYESAKAQLATLVGATRTVASDG